MSMYNVNNIYVLVHGAWHGAWCWANLVKKLEAYGHKVLTPSLPGHDSNILNMQGINLKSYVDYLGGVVQVQEQKVILVGHSMAGVVISQLAEKMPERIKKLVYVAAFLPENGHSLMNEAKQATEPGVSKITKIDDINNLIILEKPEYVNDIFFNRCEIKDAEYAVSKLQANEPFQPFIDPIGISSERFGSVEKLYIECSDDHAVSLEDQRRMHRKVQIDKICLDADHSPFISKVDDLTGALCSC